MTFIQQLQMRGAGQIFASFPAELAVPGGVNAIHVRNRTC